MNLPADDTQQYIHKISLAGVERPLLDFPSDETNDELRSNLEYW